MNHRQSALAFLGAAAFAVSGALTSVAQTASTPSTAASPSTTPSTPDQPVQLQAFVVTGLQASLADAQEIKQESPVIVDSIVASDITKLPDVNVAYALSRITGVQVAHTFAGLGGNGGVTINGLTQVENTIDGREVFTPGGTSGGGVGTGSRTYDFSQIPSQLVAGIDVYKSSAANQLDGGLGGTIDVRLHKPFDFDGPQATLTVGTTYSSLDNQDRPNYNFLVSDNFKTSAGKFGILFDASYQVQPWREDNIGVGNPVAATNANASDPNALIASGYTIDSAFGVFQTEGFDGVVQWEPFPGLQLYASANQTQWRNTENQTEFSVGSMSSSTIVPGSAQMFPGSSTYVQSASFTNVSATAFGIIRDLTDRGLQYAFGGQYLKDDLTVKFDLSRYNSAYGFYNNGVYSSVAIPSFTYSLGGTIPAATFTGVSLYDPTAYKLVQVYNRLYPATGYEDAGTLSAEYKVKWAIINAVEAGFRYASTEQDNGTTGLYLGSYNFPATANLISDYPGLVSPSPVTNFFSGYHEPEPQGFLATNQDILRNTQGLLTSFGDTTTTASTDGSVNPLSLYHIDESTTAFYIMPKFDGKLVDMDYDGNVGLRAVTTKDDLGGFETVTPASVSPTGVAVLGPLHLNDTYTDWLPSFNFRLKLTPTLYLRLAASKTITRPPFNEISPSLTLNQNPINPSLNTGSQGNPELQPLRSSNLDVSIEDYFTKSTMVYAAGFYKDVTGFPASFTQTETYANVPYQVSTYINLNPATIKGGEVGYQEFFSFLPAPFDGLGIQANYTYVSSSTPSSVQGYNIPLTNLSENSYNLVGMYEKGPFSARVAYNWRSKYVTGVSSFVGVGLLPQVVRAYGDLDASLNYQVTKNIEIAVQGVNLTNTMRFQYWGTPDVPSNLYLDGITLMASCTIKFF